MPAGGFLPFLELSSIDGAVEMTAWSLNGDAVGNGSTVPGWGYGMQLVFQRTVTLGPAHIRQGAHLGRQSILRLVSSWSAQSAVNIGKVADSVDVTLLDNETFVHQIKLDVPSQCISQSLVLRTALILHRRGMDTDSPVAAITPGSNLWKDSVTLILEGRSARMPILAADFANYQSAEKGAAWFVWTSPDWLLQDPTTGITVYINAARPALLSALGARGPDFHQTSVQSFFFHDVGRILIERALKDDDFSDDVDYGIGSAGKSLRATLRTLFGHQSIAQIRKFQERDAAGFERALQTRHKLLEGLA